MAIKFNYQQTIQQAQKLEQMASDLSGKTKGKVSGVKDTLSAAWTGNSGKNFVKFLSEAESDLDAKAKYLSNKHNEADLRVYICGRISVVRSEDTKRLCEGNVFEKAFSETDFTYNRNA